MDVNQSKLACILAAGIVLTGASGIGYLEPTIQLRDGQRIAYWKDSNRQILQSQIIPGNWFKLIASLSSFGIFAAMFPLSKMLEHEKLIDLEAERLERVKKDNLITLELKKQAMNLEAELRNEANLLNARVESMGAVHDVVEEQNAIKAFTEATGIVPQLQPQAEQEPVATAVTEATIQPRKVEVLQEMTTADNEADVIDALAALGVGGCEFREKHDGAVYTRYLVKLPVGTNTNKITDYSRELQNALELVHAPSLTIAEKGYLAVDIPKPEEDRQILNFWDYIKPGATTAKNMTLTIGVDVKNKLHEWELDSKNVGSIVIGGVPGSGKSNLLLGLLASGMVKYAPDELQFYLLDGKAGVELGWLKSSKFVRGFAENSDEEADLLDDVLAEINNRYKLFNSVNTNNLNDYVKKTGNKLPWIPTVVDEVQEFDWSETSENSKIKRSIASLGRAAGMPLILCTQRPDKKLIYNQVMSKCPTRVGLYLESKTDSELILGNTGCEKLVGRGDMLFRNGGSTNRLQALYVERDTLSRFV